MSVPPRRPVPRRVIRHRSVAAFLVALTTLALPAAASAANPVTRFAAGPVAQDQHCDPNLTPEQMSTQAAARTDFCVAFYVDSGDPAKGDDVRNTITDTPQGFAATADTTPTCSLADFAYGAGSTVKCDPAAQTGSGEARIRVDLGAGLIIPQTVAAKMWNVEHSPDEVARIGIELAPELYGIPLPHTKILGRTTLRPNPDVGLRTVIENQPRDADLGNGLGVHPIAIDGFFLRFWGSKDDHPTLKDSFALMGSNCAADQVTRIRTESWSGDTASAEDRYRLTGCDKVPFGVEATVKTIERRPDVPSGAVVEFKLADNTNPLVTSNLSETTLTLPEGLELGAQVASGDGGLPLCKASEFAWDSVAPSTCPAGSKVGDVTIISPLQSNAFSGSAYVGEQPAPGELPQLFLEGGFGSKPDSPRVKIKGNMHVDEQGRVVSVLKDVPQLLFREFRLEFKGGDHAALVTPRQCGTTQGSVQATPASGTGTVTQPIPLTIDEDCIDPAVFTPSMAVTTSNPQAGGRTVLTVATSRPDRTARLTKMVADLPAGIVSDLNQATECTTEQANANACPESSRVGSVTATSGVGPAPQTVKGSVYLHTREEGEVASVIISTRVAFGDVDLGTLAVASHIALRPADQGLTLTADIPQRFKGLALNLRSFVVALDRPDFAMNPTNCSPLTSSSQFFSDRGTQATVPLSFQVSGCDKLAFDPQLGISISGNTARLGKPSISVHVGLPAGNSNLRSTSVTMPDGLGADLDQVTRACPVAAWDAGTCGTNAVVGTLKAKVAIAPDQITGTVSMVKIAGKTLPGIGMQLEGRFATRLLGQISIDQKTGQLVTSFPNLPDVPISSLDLVLEGGPRGALISTQALCDAPSVVLKGSFTGQSGASAQRSATTNCPGALSGGTLLAKVIGNSRGKLQIKLSAPGGKKIRTARLGLPSTVGLVAEKVSKRKTLAGTKTVKVRGKRTLDAVIAKAGARAVTLTLPKGSLLLGKAAKKRKSFTVSLRVVYTSGGRETRKLTIKR